MKKSITRFLSLVLCLITLTSLLPVQAAAATTLGKPKNVAFNKTYDYSQGKLVTKYGSVSWQAASPLPTDEMPTYQVTLFRNDKVVHSQRVGWPNLEAGRYVSFDFSPFIESSGTYKATVQAVSDSGKYASSSKVTTKSWSYTKPSTKLDKPTDAGWNWPDATWSGNGIFQVQMYYSPTKVTEEDNIEKMSWFHTQWNIDKNTNRPPFGDNGPGYYRYRVRTQSTNIKQIYHSSWVYSDVYYFPMEKAEPEANLYASKGYIKVTWDGVEHASKYEVYRATKEDGDYSKVKTTTGKSFTDKDVKPGKAYYYKVRAITQAGFKTTSQPVGCIYFLGTPSVKASNVTDSGKIKLSWDKVTGAKAYEIYRADIEDGEYSLLKTTENTSYTTGGTVGTTYYYKVRAIVSSSSGANSEFSEVVSRTRKLARPVVTAKVSASTGKIKLTWDAVEGAVAYSIYRATSSDGEYEYREAVEATSYTDPDHRPGKKFYYKVVALYALDDQNPGANSYRSKAVYGTCKLARPDVSITRNSKGKPRISWDAVEGAAKYEIYRSTQKDGGYKLLKTITKTAYSDSAATKGKTYYYKVKAVPGSGSGTSSASTAVGIKSK